MWSPIFDGDGWSDLFVTADGPNALLRNNQDGRFTEMAVAAGVAAPEWNTAAVVGDIDGDGWPDLFVGSYIDLARKIDKPSGAFPQDFLGLGDHLYLNDGEGDFHFTEVTRDAGLDLDERALGALFSDLDGDGDLDLSIANDGQPNRLYRNETAEAGGAVLFTDATETAGVGDSGSGMGMAGGDYDADGRFDFIVTNWEAELNAVYRNRSTTDAMAFDYMTYRIGLTGLGNNKTAWGVAWGDFDNDTDLDFAIAHGRVPVTDLVTDPELVRLYGNMLAEGTPDRFGDWTTIVGLDAVGPLLARGSAVADFDNDGDLDVAVNTIGGDAVLLRNDRPPGRSLTVELTGFHPGAVVTVALADGTTMQREWHAGSSYLAGEDPRFHFGIGDADGAETVTVRWPDGSETVNRDVGERHGDPLRAVMSSPGSGSNGPGRSPGSGGSVNPSHRDGGVRGRRLHVRTRSRDDGRRRERATPKPTVDGAAWATEARRLGLLATETRRRRPRLHPIHPRHRDAPVHLEARVPRHVSVRDARRPAHRDGTNPRLVGHLGQTHRRGVHAA